MRLTKRNPETGQYEYKEKAKTLTEFRSQRKAVIQRLGECEDKASDLAEEIFAEIEKCSEVALMNGHIETPILCIGFGVLAELKKKYTEGKGRDKFAEFDKYSPLSWKYTEGEKDS